MFRYKTISIIKKSLNAETCNFAKCTNFVFSQSKREYSLGKLIQKWKFNYFTNMNYRHHLDNDKWAKIFVIEGNIGVGKHEFGHKFSEILDLQFYPNATKNYIITRFKGEYPDEYIEWNLNPDSVFQQMHNVSFEDFSKDPADWIHTAKLRLHMLASRNIQYCDVQAYLLRHGRGTVMIRSVYSDVVFAEAQRRMGWINAGVYDHYDLLMDTTRCYLMPPQVVLYLDIPAEQCYEQIQAGDNKMKKRFPLEYFQRLEDAYKNYYLPKARDKGVMVIEIDWTKPTPIEQIVEHLDEMPSLDAENSYWKQRRNTQFKVMRENCEDFAERLEQFKLYHPFEEIWFDEEAKFAIADEQKAIPFANKKGLNQGLGDKYIFLKGM